MDGVSLLGWKWYAIIWGGSGKPFIGCVARELYGKRLEPVSSSDLTRGRRPFAQFRKVVIYRNDYYHRNWVVNGRMACSSRMFVSVRILAQEMIGKAIITCKLSVLFVSWYYKVVCFLAYIEPFSSIMRIAQHSKQVINAYSWGKLSLGIIFQFPLLARCGANGPMDFGSMSN